MPPRAASEEGFALLSVLWVVVGIAALGLIYEVAARDAVEAAANRADLITARWRAEGCIERARAAAGVALQQAQSEGPISSSWIHLDRVVLHSPLAVGCALEVKSVRTGIDPNTADQEMISRLLRAAGVPPEATDSMSDALTDWRDSDTLPHPLGAEAAWYEAAGRAAPRNGPFADVRELARVRGFEEPGLDTLFSVERGRIDLSHAPPAVLAALPGFTQEAVARVMELRARDEYLGSLTDLEPILSTPAWSALLHNYSETSVLVTPVPDGWVIIARASAGTPPATAAVEVRLARAGKRAAVVRRRTWIE